MQVSRKQAHRYGSQICMTNPGELKTTLQRVNTLGAATEQLFSRL